jgi:hypothetical protein
MAAGPYANAIDGTNYIDAGGYIGLSPDGQYLVGYQDGPLPLGLNGSGQGVSWHIDHVSRTVATSPIRHSGAPTSPTTPPRAPALASSRNSASRGCPTTNGS